MKKIFAFALACLLLLGLCACGAAGETEGTQAASGKVELEDNYKGQYRVGYARVDITPEASVPIAGLGNTSSRMATKVTDTLYLTCLAITGTNEETVLLMHIDSQRSQGVEMEKDILQLAEDLGINSDNISITGTHTHSGPDCQNTKEPNIKVYNEMLPKKLREVCIAAMKDRKPTTGVYYGTIETVNCNFTKHYMYEDASGQTLFFGDNFGTEVINETTRHTRKADPNIYIMKFEREGEKPIVMCNFTGHPHLFTKQESTQITGDLSSYWRAALELEYDCKFMLFNGGAGNVNITTRLGKEKRFQTYEGGKAGKIFADYTIDCLNNNMTKVNAGKVYSVVQTLEYKTNKPTVEEATKAKEYQAIYSATGDKAAAVAASNGQFRSIYHIQQVVANEKLTDTRTTFMRVFSVADNTAMVVSGGEQFSENAEAVRAESPFDFTMYFSYSDRMKYRLGYVASAYGWSYTSYETDVATCAQGTAEQMVGEFNRMLKELKAKTEAGE